VFVKSNNGIKQKNMITKTAKSNKYSSKISLRQIFYKTLFSIYLLFFVGTYNLKSQIIIGSNNVVKLEAGVYLNAEGDWQNNGLFMSDSASYVKLSGGQQEISGAQATRFANLIIEGQGHKILSNIIQQYIEVSQSLVFNAQKIEINNNDLILLSDAVIINANNQRFVITTGTGRLIKEEVPHNIDFLFPVGTTPNSYTPVTINYAGITDTFAVRVFDGVNPPDQSAVQKTYLVKSSNPGVSIADISLAWHTADEGTFFLPAQALMWQQQAGIWNMLNTPQGAQSNTPATDWFYEAYNVQFLSNTTDSLILKTSAPPTIISQPTDIALCETETATFTVIATAIGAISYQWQINCSGTWSNITNGGLIPQYFGANDSMLVIANVPYALNGCAFRCIVSTFSGQTISDPAVLTVYPQPSVSIAGDTAFCQGQQGTLMVITTANVYSWNTGDTTQIIHIFPAPPSQTYSVTVSDNNNCVNIAQKSVLTTTPIDVNLTSNYAPDHTIYVGQQIKIIALPPGYHNYDFFIGNSLVQSGASHVYTTATLTQDVLIYVNAYYENCQADDSLWVKVKPIPNAFTPFDKNNKNDLFGKGADLVIINRWGQTLYEGKDGWNGTYNDARVSPGTYFFMMTFNKNTSEEFIVKGHVLVVSEDL